MSNYFRKKLPGIICRGITLLSKVKTRSSHYQYKQCRARNVLPVKISVRLRQSYKNLAERGALPGMNILKYH